jgi:hypothetical protein
VTVALAEGLPEAHGRRWTAEDYATRDAALAQLGLSLHPRSSRGARPSHRSAEPGQPA